MVRSEAIALLNILKANYPSTYRGLSKEEANDIINLWTTMFTDEPIQLVTEAIKAMICTHKYPPTIADVKEKIRLITEKPHLTEMEAWVIVSKAITDSAYHAGEHFDNFPDIIKNVIRQPEQLRMWGQMDVDTVNSVVQSNFMRSYKAMSQHQEQIQRLPSSTKTMIEELKTKMLMEVNP